MNYAELCFLVQCERRNFEAIRTPIIPSLGVGAKCYTHQVSNVHRVLTDIGIRHLIADEVGLGKTIQALMILNALKYQQDDFKALVIVPDRLVTQWRDEMMARAHTAPFDDEEEIEGEQYIQLLWENKIRSRVNEGGSNRLTKEDLDFNKFNILVVDELHRLPASMQDTIVRLSPFFEHVLILTATPAFQQPKRYAQLYAILEPLKMERARKHIFSSKRAQVENIDLLEDLSNWPDWANEEIVNWFHEREQNALESCSTDEELIQASLNFCSYRRVIRSRRKDFTGILPNRNHIPILISPLKEEYFRQKLMWKYFQHLHDLSRSFDPVLLAKRVILGHQSLQQRVTFLIGHGHDRHGIIEKVRDLNNKKFGDSRLDALIDILNLIWEKDSNERVIIAAQDNLTVDYLREQIFIRLPLVGPLGKRRTLKIAYLRQGMTEEMLDDLSGYNNETAINLEEFQRGESLLLLASDRGQIGLNLQRARILVLYSVPWNPEEVEQWIGRLDRIGNEAAYKKNGEANYIDIYTIAHESLIDENIIKILQEFKVFERSVNLDNEHLQIISNSIEDVALGTETMNWDHLGNKVKEFALKDQGLELESPLKKYLPWNSEWAKNVYIHFLKLPPSKPTLLSTNDPQTGPLSWDKAFERSIKILSKIKQYEFRNVQDLESDTSFKTIWYRFGEIGRPRPVLSKVVFSFGSNPHSSSYEDRHPRNCFAYILRRNSLQTPPLRRVSFMIDKNLVNPYLRFLSFGDQLHDELIQGWQKDKFNYFIKINLENEKTYSNHIQKGLYIIRITTIDSAYSIRSSEDNIFFNDQLKKVLNEFKNNENTPSGDLNHFQKLFKSFIDADSRWVRSNLMPEFCINAIKYTNQGWKSLNNDEIENIFNPVNKSHSIILGSEWRNIPSDIHNKIIDYLEIMTKNDKEMASKTWSHQLPKFFDILKMRISIVENETKDALYKTSEEINRNENLLSNSLEKGVKGQITRSRNNLKISKSDHLLTKIIWEKRLNWLRELKEKILDINPETNMNIVLNVN